MKTTLLPERRSAALARYQVSARDEIVDMLKRLRDAGIGVTCYIEGGFIPAEARIDAVLPAQNMLVMIAASELEHDLLAAARAITAVAFTRGVKIQFDAFASGSVATTAGAAVRVSLPGQVLRLQRRAHGRVKPSRIRPLECMVRGESNCPSLLRMPVFDISVGGVALLARARRDPLVAGQRLINCSFDLAEDGEVTTDLIVRNVERTEGAGGWRYGCAFSNIADGALERVCCYVERIESQRRDALATKA